MVRFPFYSTSPLSDLPRDDKHYQQTIVNEAYIYSKWVTVGDFMSHYVDLLPIPTYIDSV